MTVVFAILSFTVVNVAGVMRGQSVTQVWLTSILAMVIFSIVGFSLGLVFDTLIRDTMVREDAAMFTSYLDDHPDAGGDYSDYQTLDDEAAEDGEAKIDYSVERDRLSDSA